MNFMNLWTIYSDLLKGHYIPSCGHASINPDEGPENASERWPVGITVMFLLYGYFYSLVEDSDDGINGFRLWHERHPEEIEAIGAVEAQVAPFLDALRLFRNRLGFHGSRTRTHEARGFELFNSHSGEQVLNALRNFKALGAALFGKENAQQGISGYSIEAARQNLERVTEKAKVNLGLW